MKILEIENVKKSFGKVHAVSGISLHVERGEIVGFVGPNGSGKTTTLKMVTNLIWPDEGSIMIGGYDLMKHRKKALSHIAGIVENPGLYANLTGMDNLKFIQKIRKIPETRLRECIELTGLGVHLKRSVAKYSLGMKQRLALGMSLLTDPELLLLDEPTNGLDPTGVIELREMLKTMRETQNMSILFSSHQLGEVEKLADRIVYIKRGLIVEQENEFNDEAKSYLLRVLDPMRALEILRTHPDGIQCEIHGSEEIMIRFSYSTIGQILTDLETHHISVLDVEKCNQDLEAVYRQLYRNEEGGGRIV